MRSRLTLLALLPAIVTLCTSCIPLQEYRNVTVVKNADGDYEDRVCEIDRGENMSSDRCAVEHRKFEIPADPDDPQTYPAQRLDYLFASVEFDDRGWFWDRRQMETLLRQLYDGSQEYLIFTFAHGWQHNADACDENVICVQRILERLVYTENRLNGENARKIVGVYIGWRGRSGGNKPARVLSFYNRKRAANRVGIGGVNELLTRLNDFRDYRNPEREVTKTQLVITGHSFGGQVIYKALAHNLVERAAEMEAYRDIKEAYRMNPGADYGYEIASSFGDLVILVNPAFEGSAYEPLQFAATNRCYPDVQRPAMLVVTSTADAATRTTFPLGRKLSNGLSKTRCPDQRQAMLRTVGHLDRYTTHVLELEGVAKGKKLEEQQKREPCDCRYLPPISEIYTAMRDRDNAFFRQLQTIARLEESNTSQNFEPHPDGEPKPVEVGADGAPIYDESFYGYDYQQDGIVLRQTGGYAANYPYLVVQTDGNFIPSHSAIYGQRFTDFIRRFYLRHLSRRINFPEECFEGADPRCIDSPITPCQRSWKGRPDTACEPDAEGRPPR